MDKLVYVNLPTPTNKLLNKTVAFNATHTPLSPATPMMNSPFSPITPASPPHFGLRQSSTDLAVIEDPNPFDTASLCSIDENSLIPPSPTMNVDSSGSSILDTHEMLMNLSLTQHDCFLFKNGYKKLRKISDTQQGAIYEGIIIDPYKRAKMGLERIAIKQTSKSLHKSHEAIQDDLRVIVEENIVKEAMILKHLTRDNRPNGGYIAKFIDFMEDKDDYYLIMEYVGDRNLAQFVETAHQYIKDKKLKLSDYKKVIKFLFWQICVMVHWMHHDMKCVHLDLCLENIIVRDGTFIIDENTGNVSISSNIAVKLADFGLSEIYAPNARTFECGKWGLKDSFTTTSPNVYNELMYDGQKADIWSLGCILYEISTGKSLYDIPDQDVDAGFYCIENNKIGLHLEIHRLERYFNSKMLRLLENMLNIDQNKRFSALQVLQCQWFVAYYNRYKTRIDKKSKAQKEQLKKQQNKMRFFPYYTV